MDGMTVLNEVTTKDTPIGLAVVVTILAVLFLGLILFSLMEAEAEGALLGFILLLIFGGLSIAAWATINDATTQYEVTLEQGAVIDATQWEIVEQRGDIYVLEAK